MNRCPITYELCGNQKYSIKGLKLISRNLKHLKDFPYTPKEQIQLASQLAAKLSIQGVQPKLSIILNGATPEEIEDAVHYAKSSVGWSAYISGLQIDFDQFRQEIRQACEHVKKNRT